MSLNPLKDSFSEAMLNLIRAFEKQNCTLEEVKFSDATVKPRQAKAGEPYGVSLVKVD